MTTFVEEVMLSPESVCFMFCFFVCLFVCVHYSLNPDLSLNIPSFVELHLTHLKVVI